MATFAYTPGTRHNFGDQTGVSTTATWASTSYTSSGEYIYANILGLSVIQAVSFEDSKGYTFDANIATDGSYFRLKAYVGGTGSSGATSAGTPAGSVAQVTGTNTQVTGTIGAPTKVYRTMGIPYMRGSANTDHQDADQSATVTNGAWISTLAAADNTNALTLAKTQTDCPRNICIVIKNNEGATAHNLIASNYAIVGTYNGVAQTETIAFTDVSSVAATKFRYLYGVKPFDTITSITPSAAQSANMQHSAGLGSKVGLPRTLYTPAEGDVVMFTAQGVPVSITSTVNTTYNTINTGVRTDNDYLVIKYAYKGYDAAPAFTGSTPAFTGSTPGFTGSALATHTHTITGVMSEVSGTISAVVDMMVIGY